MHATVMVITPVGKSLDDNLAKYDQNAEEGDGSGARFIYYSNEDINITPGDTVEKLIENYKEETGKDMDPSEYYTHNVYGYYDWYSVGGRWAGFFKAIDNPSKRAKIGERSWTNEKVEILADRIDYGLVSDIDWLGMSKELLERVTPAFEIVWKAIEDLPLSEKSADLHFSDQLRHKAVLKLAEESELVKQCVTWILSGEGRLLDLSLEKALEQVALIAFSTYSLIYNGEWYDKNDFDVSMGNKISEIIKEIYSKGQEDKYMVYLVDYHS